MIVVAAVGKPGVDDGRLTARHRQTQDMAAAVEKEACTIVHPVGRFKALWRNIPPPPVRGSDGDRLQRAVENRTNRGRSWFRCYKIDIREHGSFDGVLFVRTNANSYVKRAVERKLD